MSTIKSVEGTAANGATAPIDDPTAISPTYERSDLPEKLHRSFWQIMDKRSDIEMGLENGEKHGVLKLLASLRLDFLEFRNLVIAHNDEQVRNNDPSKEKPTAPASRADVLALQKQIEQLCDASKQNATPPDTTQNDMRAELALLKKDVAELGTTVKNDKEAQQIAMQRVKVWSKVLRAKLPAFLNDLWDATEESTTQRASFPKTGHLSSDDDAEILSTRLRAKEAKLATVQAKMSAMRARRAAWYVTTHFSLFA